MGKIEVVVLRCDAEQAVAEGPRAIASALMDVVKAPSAKAPSAKAPSAKAPSAGKPASEGLGGMFGLFDGAYDFGLDGAGDAKSFPIPEFDVKGRRWDPVAGLYRWAPSALTTNGASYSYIASSRSGYTDELHNLDGPEHNYPGVVVDRYGQPYAQRVPYYNASAARKPRGDNHGRRASSPMGSVQGGGISAPPLGRGEQVIGYTPKGTPIVAQPRQQQPQALPTRVGRQYPKVVIGPDGREYVDTLDPDKPQNLRIGRDGQQYIDVSSQQQPQTHAPCAAAVPVVQRRTRDSPLRAARPEPTTKEQDASRDGVPEGFVVILNKATGDRYAVPENVAHKYIEYHQTQQQHEPTDDQELLTTEMEQQRSIILELGHNITKLLGHDCKLLAAAVPHIPLLKKYNIMDCLGEKRGELQRQLNEVIVSLHKETTDVEHQRSLIFDLGHDANRIFGHDYKLIAAAVPHIPILRKYKISQCIGERRLELQRQLDQVLSHSHFPNGEKIVPMHDVTTDDQQNLSTDVENQRSIIFELGHDLTRVFGHDYRLIAAAVPHLPVLKKHNILECSSGEKGVELKRQLDGLFSHRHFPNGDRIVRMHDPRDDEVPDSKTPTKKHPAAPEVAKDRVRQQQTAYDDTAVDRRWIDEAVDKSTEIDRQWQEEMRKEKEEAERMKRHQEPYSRSTTDRRPTAEQAPQHTAQDHESADKAAGEYADIRKAWREERHKVKEERKKRHEERHDRRQAQKELKKMQDEEELKKKDGGSRHSSSRTESTLSHWASTVTSERESRKGQTEAQEGQIETQNEDTRSRVSSSHGWNAGNTGDPTAGNNSWDNSGPPNEIQPPADNNIAQTNPNPPTDGNNEPQTTQEPLKAPSYHHHTQSIMSSNKSSYSHPRSTTTSRTIDPNAAIQPYFDVLHPNDSKASNSKTNIHQTPIPRTPYVYPPTQAPHLPSAALGDRSHGVRAGKGAEYTHATLRPKYLDTMERPYAVFVFEYRSVEKLGQILGHRGEELRSDMEKVQEEVGMGVLMNLPKEKLVEELLRAKENAARGGGEAAAPAAVPEVAPPEQEKMRSIKAVETWNTKQQSYHAAPAVPAAEPAPAAAPYIKAATHSHHSNSKKSESKSKKPEDTKVPTVAGDLENAWSTGGGDVAAEGAGFAQVGEGNTGNTKW